MAYNPGTTRPWIDEKRGKLAVLVSSGLLAMTVGGEMLKPSTAEARVDTAAETVGKKNPIMERTDQRMKAVIKEIKALDKKHTKGVDIKHLVMEDGAKVDQFSVSVPHKDPNGAFSYDMVVAFAYSHSTTSANQDIPFSTRVIIGSPDEVFSFDGNFRAMALMGRGFFPEDTYYIYTYNSKKKLQDVIPLSSGQIKSKNNYNILDNTYGQVTDIAKIIVNKAGEGKQLSA